MITLTVATIGGEVAAFAFLAERGLSSSGRAAFATAMGLSFLALVAFLDSYIGLLRRGHVQAGPSIRSLVERAKDPQRTAEHHLLSLLASHAGFFEHNAALMLLSSRPRRAGLAALGASACLAAGSALYLLG